MRSRSDITPSFLQPVFTEHLLQARLHAHIHSVLAKEPADGVYPVCRHLAGSQTLISKRAELDQIVSGPLPRKGVGLTISLAHMTCYIVTLPTKYNLDPLCHASWFSSLRLGRICPLQPFATRQLGTINKYQAVVAGDIKVHKITL